MLSTNAKSKGLQPSFGVLSVTLFGIALAVRSAFLAWVDLPAVFGKYPIFAQRLLQGESLGERLVDLSPFYLYLTAAVQFIIGTDAIIMKCLHAVVGALVAVILFSIGCRLNDRRTGMVAGLLYALYGNGIVLETALEPTVWVILLNLAAIALLLRWADMQTPRLTALAPAAMAVGLSILAKPNFLLFLPIGAAYVWFRSTAMHRRFRVKSVGVFVGITIAIVLSITLRNFIALGEPILVTADAGKVFYHGNGPGATALNWTGPPHTNFEEEGAHEPDYEHVLFRQIAAKALGRPVTPSESSRYWTQQTIKAIRADPARFASLIGSKLIFFFSNYETHYIATSYAEYIDMKRGPWVPFGILAGVGLLGMAIAYPARKQWAIIYGAFALYLISGLIFIVQSRYRMPAVPYLCLFAGLAVSHTIDMAQRTPSRIIVTVLLAGAFTACSSLTFRDSISGLDRWQRATKIHYQINARSAFDEGRFKDALQSIDQCLKLAPNFAPAINLKGLCHAHSGDIEAARVAFARVIQLAPTMARGYVNMANTYLMVGDTESARRYLDHATQVAPNDATVKTAMERLHDNG